jgi:UDP-2,3-diacylglucosamine pyrophosphatase LpxH
MGIDKKQAEKRLGSLLSSPHTKILPTKDKKYAIVSDIHLGNGGGADDFRDNKDCLIAALNYYFKNDFFLILLGDVEEFWQFTLDEIVLKYGDVYSNFRKFSDGRVIRVFGNHDIDWKYAHDPVFNENTDDGAVEALKMYDINNNPKIFLVHGHQGDDESDTHAWSSRIAVRLFREIEPIADSLGLYGNDSFSQSEKTEEYEQTYYNWAKANKVLLICGHTHRAIFASLNHVNRMEKELGALQQEIKDNPANHDLIAKNIRKIYDLGRKIQKEKFNKRDIDITKGDNPVPCYFNTGCGVFEDGITFMEISGDDISLIKWDKESKEREIYQSGQISQFIKVINT